VAVTGKVAKRPEGSINPKLGTGEIEVRAVNWKSSTKVLRPRFNPPARICPARNPLKYRYVDLRRPEMQRTLVLRHRMIKIMRDYFDAMGFLEVETPMLGRSTPGARAIISCQPGAAGFVLCLAAIAPALQADFNGGRLRPIYAGCPLFSRRGLARPTASPSSLSWTWKCRLSMSTT